MTFTDLMQADAIQLIRTSYARFSAHPAESARAFYRELFILDPRLRTLFVGDLERQGDKLMHMLSAAVRLLDRPERLLPVLEELGRRHVGYGVIDAHYDTVGYALIRALEVRLGADFDQDTRYAWVDLYKVVASTMRKAAAAPLAA